MIPPIAFVGVAAVGALAFSGGGTDTSSVIDSSTVDPVASMLDGSDSFDSILNYSTTDYSMSTANLNAFLAVLRAGESSNQYNALYGGGTFSDYSKFPVWSGKDNSHAAGAYQFEPATWAQFQASLDLPDFSPASQDKAAVGLLMQQNAYTAACNGDISTCMQNLTGIWTSLAARGQSWVTAQFSAQGGTLA